MVYNAVHPGTPSAMRSRIISFLSERWPGAIPTALFGAVLAVAGLSLGALLAVALSSGAAQAQGVAKPGSQAAPQAVPGFWDPRRRPDRPDLSRLTVIRFLTETDYPPFNLKRKPEEAAADLKRYL